MFVKFLSQNPSRFYLVQCLLFLVALGAVFSFTTPYFLAVGNINNILTAIAVIGLLALGATFVIASGGIDLSPAAVMALTSCLCADLIQKAGIAPPLAFVLTLAAGSLCGGLTGAMINLTKAPSFIVTLGMMSITRAGAYILTDGVPVYGMPDSVLAYGQSSLGGVPIPAVILVLCIIMAHIILAHTRFGIQALILGDNPTAALATGIRTGWMRVRIFALAGFFSSVAGIIFTLRTNAGDPSAGIGYELIAITAVILGGANLMGGRATIVGSVLGILCLGILQNGLNLLGVSSYFQVLFVGIVLLAAAFLSRSRGRA